MKLRQRWSLVLAAVVAAVASSAQATVDISIGVYFDAAGTVCSGTITPAHPGTIYIVAKSAPGSLYPAGAEFRFGGLPASWTVYPVPNPGIISIGNPFTNGAGMAGAGIQCNPGGRPTFVFYTVLVLATETVDNVRFDLEASNTPSNPAFHCPVVIGCDLPVFAMHCTHTVPCFVNTSTPAPCSVPTAVEATTWTGLRSLYR
jgi:hypothetical protein